MALTRLVTATRASSVVRTRTRFISPLAFRRPASTGGKRDDLGGPGGQDPVPKTSSGVTQDTTSYLAIGGVGVLVCTIFYYMTSHPDDAARKQGQAKAAVAAAKDKAKDAVKS